MIIGGKKNTKTVYLEKNKGKNNHNKKKYINENVTQASKKLDMSYNTVLLNCINESFKGMALGYML